MKDKEPKRHENERTFPNKKYSLEEVFDNNGNLRWFEVKCEDGQVFTIGPKPGRVLILTKSYQGETVSAEKLMKDPIIRPSSIFSPIDLTYKPVDPYQINNYIMTLNKTFRTAGLIKPGEKLVTGNLVHGYRYLGK